MTWLANDIGITSVAVLVLNVAVRVYSGVFMIISDCDETYNYWEPLNLLLRGFGKQTWEYSPEYAIRSYAYLLPYYVVGFPLGFILSLYQFYGIRLIALAGFTSYCEISLFLSLKRNFNTNTANWFLFLSSIAPGMSHASIALLPSSFAMQTTLLAVSNSLEALTSDTSAHYTYAIFWYLLGGIGGWPFALALGIPFGFYTLAKFNFNTIKKCALALALITTPIILIDSYFYSKLVFVPLNIVKYNIFGSEGEGPDIFGVEDLSYYILNLLLNFNFIVVIAYMGLIINPFIFKKSSQKVLVTTTFPMFIWTIVFFTQPHKEERFLYPMYPLISLNAALLIVKIFGFIPQNLSKFMKILTLVTLATISWLRILNLVENYSAPLAAVAVLNNIQNDRQTNVCSGKEWYHFPTSFFLNDNQRLKYVKSGFDGILPGDFNEKSSSLREITSFISPHVNNKNQFEPSTVIDVGQCDYFIDNNQESIDEQEWKSLSCLKLINPDGKHGYGRLLYIPHFLRKYLPYNVEYMNFCVYKRDSKV